MLYRLSLRGLVPALITASLFLTFTLPSFAHAIAALAVPSDFTYYFAVNGTLKETGSMQESWSPYWWLNSGGYLILDNDRGTTVQGSLPSDDSMRKLYASSNSTDTDNGYHPQNLFRLVSRSTWQNVAVESNFKIERDQFSASSNRNASNGLLHMLRYQDSGQTLYYAGIRVDGNAVIKKKYKGTYTTLAIKKIYPGTYAIANNVNLLPHNDWIMLHSEALTNANGTVTVKLSVKNPTDGSLIPILEATDSSNPILSSGSVGIRTDFMDVTFDTFHATKI